MDQRVSPPVAIAVIAVCLLIITVIYFRGAGPGATPEEIEFMIRNTAIGGGGMGDRMGMPGAGPIKAKFTPLKNWPGRLTGKVPRAPK